MAATDGKKPIKLVIPPHEVDEQDPFGSDLLGRKTFAEDLTRILGTLTESLVVALDAPWGTGKTVFLKQWLAHLNAPGSDRYLTVYIDAYESDYLGDVPGAIVEGLIETLEKAMPDGEADGSAAEEGEESHLSKIRDHLVNLRSQWLKIGWKIGSDLGRQVLEKHLGVSLGVMEKMLNPQEPEAQDARVPEERTQYQQRKEAFEAFRALLGELASAARADTGHPLIVVIDELDRCRPDHAVHLLETIKHLFSVENVVFVLSIHKGQLEDAIRAVHGCSDPDVYLQKLVQLVCQLPKGNRVKTPFDYYEAYANHLLREHGLNERIKPGICFYMAVLAEHYDLSLREIDRIFTLLALLAQQSANRYDERTQIWLLLATIAIHLPKAFDSLPGNAEMSGVEAEGWLENEVGLGVAARAFNENIKEMVELLHFGLKGYKDDALGDFKPNSILQTRLKDWTREAIRIIRHFPSVPGRR